MIKQQNDKEWLASCPICSWKQKFSAELDAQAELNNHINLNHREGKKALKEKEAKVPPKNLPPQIPSPVKER